MSAICFNLDQSEILSSGLKLYGIHVMSKHPVIDLRETQLVNKLLFKYLQSQPDSTYVDSTRNAQMSFFVEPTCIESFGTPRVMGAIESLSCNWWSNMHQIDA